MNGSDLGSIYQFENRLGVGYERETYRSVLNIFHYSNGGLEGKNDGVDIIMLSVSKYFLALVLLHFRNKILHYPNSLPIFFSMKMVIYKLDIFFLEAHFFSSS